MTHGENQDPLAPHSHEIGLDVTVHHVPITSLKEADSLRSHGVDMRHVEVLAENADTLPPIVVHRATMQVVDGMHRLHALKIRKYPTIGVRYFDGTSQEAFLVAVESNTKHGLPLSLSDRKKAALRILGNSPQWSDRAVASQVGLDHKTVGVIRRTLGDHSAQPDVRIGRDGKAHPLSAVAGRVTAEQAIVRNPQITLRDIAKLSGISAETARHVRKNVERRTVPATRGANKPSVPGTSVAAALESLRRDPAVRYCGERRALLRWLEARLVSEQHSHQLMRMPPHQASALAVVARSIAACWSEVAERLEEQVPQGR
ncbi:ParB/RepB/Spo0J family partition protein [Streptomyces niveus]|uniref:ParB/RepB/Spo0J family partition protein n=1 Tax=Streptomyces niveus TaxID=193462 RepID=UPI0036D35E99